jgi:hypothetical protein
LFVDITVVDAISSLWNSRGNYYVDDGIVVPETGQGWEDVYFRVLFLDTYV